MLLYSNLPPLPLSGIQREMERMFDDGVTGSYWPGR